MRDLSKNAKLHLANLKTYFDKKDAFAEIPDPIKKELTEKGYWDSWHRSLTKKSYGSYSEWFENEYVGSKREKLEYETTEHCDDSDGEVD